MHSLSSVNGTQSKWHGPSHTLFQPIIMLLLKHEREGYNVIGGWAQISTTFHAASSQTHALTFNSCSRSPQGKWRTAISTEVITRSVIKHLVCTCLRHPCAKELTYVLLWQTGEETVPGNQQPPSSSSSSFSCSDASSHISLLQFGESLLTTFYRITCEIKSSTEKAMKIVLPWLGL